VNTLRCRTASACRQHFQGQKVSGQQLQAYTESLIRTGSTRSKLLAFLKQPQSICGWTTLSLPRIQ